MAETALSGIKIVELGGFIAAPYCTKLMADLGAEVIKVEEPGKGDPARSYGPFPDDDPHPERSLLFAYMNTNKLGITLDKQLLKELLRDADVLVESNPPKMMKELGLDYQSLSAINPRLIVTSITPFGQTGPYRDYKSTDLVSFHMGGVAYMTPGDIQDPDNQPPLKAPGHQADFMAGITGIAGTMCAVIGRKLTGRGEHVDVSEQEPVVRTGSGDIVAQTHRGQTPSRIGRVSARPLKAKDGLYTVVPDTYDHTWTAFVKTMGSPAWAESDMFNDRQSRQDNRNALGSHIEEWSKNYTKDELYQMLQVESHVMYLPINTIEDVVTNRHLAERGFFVEMDHPQIGKFKAPGSPYTFSDTPWRIASPAPTRGQHNRDIICDRLGYSKEDLVRMRQFGAI